MGEQNTWRISLSQVKSVWKISSSFYNDQKEEHRDSSRLMCLYYILLFLTILLHTFTLLTLSVSVLRKHSGQMREAVMFLGLGHPVNQRRYPSNPPYLVVVYHQLILHCDCCKTEDPCMQIVLQRLRVSFLVAEMN